MALQPRYTAKSLLAVFFIVFSPWLLFAARTDASPVPSSNATLVQRYVPDNISPKDSTKPGPSTSDYPSDSEILTNFRQGLPLKGWVFWTGISPSTDDPDRDQHLAETFARQNGFNYIYDAYPEQFVCRRATPDDDPRSEAWWMNYVDRVSGTFADQVRGPIYLVTEMMDGVTNMESTYWRVERPTLMDWGHELITFVNANNFEDQRLFSIKTNKPISDFPVTVTPDAKVNQTLNHGNNTHINHNQTAVGKIETVHQLQHRSNADSFLDKYSLNWQGYGDDPSGPCVNKVLPPLYAPGWCGVHIYQFRGQKILSFAPTPYWDVNVTLKDANGEWIKNTGVRVGFNGDTKTVIDSDFPYTFDIVAGTKGWGDTDPLLLKYSKWSALTQNGKRCNVGAYGNGYRQMDCGFPC